MSNDIFPKAIKSAAYLATLGSPFLLSPPTAFFHSSTAKGSITLTQFALALVIGICGLFVLVFKPSVKTWFIIAVLSAIAFTVSLINYQQIRVTAVADCLGTEKIVGSVCQDHVLQDYKTCPSPNVILPDFAYDPTQIWTPQSIQRNTTSLTAWYLLMLATLAIAVVSLGNGSADHLTSQDEKTTAPSTPADPGGVPQD